MKKIIFIAIAAIALSACQSKGNKQSEKTATATTLDTTRSKAVVYQCPMDEEITSDKPGKCSKCGMDLELKK